MKFEPALRPARLLSRYKRFLADAVTPEGETFTLHCANTGAMTGCATPRYRLVLHFGQSDAQIPQQLGADRNAAGSYDLR